MYWPKLSSQQIKTRIFEALSKNRSYRDERILGIPATYLDTDVFYADAPFLRDAPFLSVLIANPNHIGCHTLSDDNEPIFKGTQEIERDLIRICAEEIFAAEPGGYDGYVAAGGTEANIEAAWIYRNYFIREHRASASEIALVYSQDSHYSFPKAANLLGLKSCVLAVDPEDRCIDIPLLKKNITQLMHSGIKYFIVNVNLSTTMFGSVDDIDEITSAFIELGAKFKLHVDAAFGGFIFPFLHPDNQYSFSNPHVGSITVDGHKLLQAPYGTGIFLCRKSMMQYVCTEEATYVQGKDYTLTGSRSGANAACVWMILHMHGSVGWKVKMEQLLDKTASVCYALDRLKVRYYRNRDMNIIAIRSANISQALASRYLLVPDKHEQPSWYKIVVMPHVSQGMLDTFISELESELQLKKLTHEPAQ